MDFLPSISDLKDPFSFLSNSWEDSRFVNYMASGKLLLKFHRFAKLPTNS